VGAVVVVGDGAALESSSFFTLTASRRDPVLHSSEDRSPISSSGPRFCCVASSASSKSFDDAATAPLEEVSATTTSLPSSGSFTSPPPPVVVAAPSLVPSPPSLCPFNRNSGAPSLNAWLVFSRARESPMSSQNPVALSFFKNRPSFLRTMSTTSSATLGLSFFLARRYCCWYCLTNVRKLRLPMWEFVAPPRPQSTSVSRTWVM